MSQIVTFVEICLAVVLKYSQYFTNTVKITVTIICFVSANIKDKLSTNQSV